MHWGAAYRSLCPQGAIDLPAEAACTPFATRLLPFHRRALPPAAAQCSLHERRREPASLENEGCAVANAAAHAVPQHVGVTRLG